MAETDLDALGLLAGRRRTTIRFGTVDVASAFIDGKVNSVMNEGTDARLNLDFERSAFTPDYFAGLTMVVEHGGTSRPSFAGTVATVTLENSGASVHALGAISLSEGRFGTFVHRGLSTPELVYTLARAGGMREDQLHIAGLETLTRETFEIVTPVSGVTVREPTEYAGVHFIPPPIAVRILADLDARDGAYPDFEASAYALALVTAPRMLSAEDAGLGAIDFALAWLTTSLRYGHAVLPGGAALDFSRKDSLVRLLRHELVAVRGVQTGRFWLRRPGMLPEPHTIPLMPDGARLQPEPPRLTLQERLAFLALSRAAHEPDLLTRVLALFEAIEFYVSGTQVEHVFTSDELKQIRKGVPRSLKPEQKSRIGEFISNLNEPPLRRLLMKALDLDGVPYTAGEIAMLWDLRKLRNEVVHGRSKEMPKAEDVEYATSIVARMLVYRAARHRRDGDPN